MTRYRVVYWTESPIEPVKVAIVSADNVDEARAEVERQDPGYRGTVKTPRRVRSTSGVDRHPAPGAKLTPTPAPAGNDGGGHDA